MDLCIIAIHSLPIRGSGPERHTLLQGGFQQAWEQAPVESPPGDAVRGYRALCVAADATLSAAAVSQGEDI